MTVFSKPRVPPLAIVVVRGGDISTVTRQMIYLWKTCPQTLKQSPIQH